MSRRLSTKEKQRLFKKLTREAIKLNQATVDKTDAYMRKTAREYNRVGREIKALVVEMIEKAGEWDYNELAKYNRYRILLNQINEELTKLGEKEIGTLDIYLKTATKETYDKTSYELAKAKVGTSQLRLSSKKVEAIVHYPYKGQLFSDTIWDNKRKLMSTIRKELTQSMVLGEHPYKVARRISKTMKSGRYDSERVARTEMMRVHNIANESAMKDNKVDKVQYKAVTHDERTCEVCGEYHNKIYDRDDDTRPVLPLHPHCRCGYVPYIE